MARAGLALRAAAGEEAEVVELKSDVSLHQVGIPYLLKLIKVGRVGTYLPTVGTGTVLYRI